MNLVHCRANNMHEPACLHGFGMVHMLMHELP